MPSDLEAILEKFANTIDKQQKSMETLMQKVELYSNGVSRDSDNAGASGSNTALTNGVKAFLATQGKSITSRFFKIYKRVQSLKTTKSQVRKMSVSG